MPTAVFVGKELVGQPLVALILEATFAFFVMVSTRKGHEPPKGSKENAQDSTFGRIVAGLSNEVADKSKYAECKNDTQQHDGSPVRGNRFASMHYAPHMSRCQGPR